MVTCKRRVGLKLLGICLRKVRVKDWLLAVFPAITSPIILGAS
jgi:hypothetical protein